MNKVMEQLAEVFVIRPINTKVYRVDTTFYLSGGLPLIIYFVIDGRTVSITDEGALLESIYLPIEEDLNTQLLDSIGAKINHEDHVIMQTKVRKLTKDVFKYIEALMDTSALYNED